MARPKKQHNIAWIAETAGVSVATVSNTLNNRAGVSEETRRKIQSIISGSVYQRSYRNVSPRTITVLSDHLGSWYMMDCLTGIIEYTAEADINLNTVIYRPGHGKPLSEQLRAGRSDGVIITALGLRSDDLEEIAAMNLPAVMIDDTSDNVRIGYVNNDSRQGSYDLAQHLIGLGHRQIAYLTYHVVLPQQQNTLARLNGWRQALRETGASEADLENLLHTATYEEIPAVVESLVQSGDITALMVADDHMALAVIQTCHTLGVKIPDELSVTGFDDVFDAQYYYPALTTARHHGREIARRAVLALDDLLSGKTDRLIREMSPTELIIRASTGPVCTRKNIRKKEK